MLIVSLPGKSIPVRESATSKTVWLGGRPNQLSKDAITRPLIDSLPLATKRSSRGSSGTSFISVLFLCDEALVLPAKSVRRQPRAEAIPV